MEFTEQQIEFLKDILEDIGNNYSNQYSKKYELIAKAIISKLEE